MKNKKFTIIYHESSNKLAFRFPFSEPLKKKFHDMGMRFEKKYKEWYKEFEPGDFSLTLSLGDHWDKSESFLKLEQKHQEIIRSLKIKKGITSPEYENLNLRILPKDHQKLGVSWLNSIGGSAILNDAPGTGKTLQALLYCHAQNRPAVVLCPKHLVKNWEREITSTFFEKDLIGKKFYIYNMDSIAHNEIEQLDKFSLVIDESHNIKSLKSKRFKQAYKLAKKSLSTTLLTGHNFDKTPEEFYIQLKLLQVDITKSRYMKRFFITSFENMKTRIISVKTSAINLSFDYLKIKRTLEDVGHSLDTKNYQLTLNIDPSTKNQIKELIKEEQLFFTGNKVQKINKVVSLSKVPPLLKFVKNELTQDPSSKIVIFSQFSEVLKEFKIRYPLAQVLTDDSEDFDSNILLVDSSKYREGINLSEYSVLILMDCYADKNKNLQIKRRLNRIGQKNAKIRCYYALAGLIDSIIYKMPNYLGYDASLSHIKKELNKAC